MRFGAAFDFGTIRHAQQRRRSSVSLALKLDVLAAFTAIAFIGAIVLGVF